MTPPHPDFNTLEEAAFHEAGHAVAALALGWTVTGAEVRWLGASYGGWVGYRPPPASTAGDDLVITVAGCAAAARAASPGAGLLARLEGARARLDHQAAVAGENDHATAHHLAGRMAKGDQAVEARRLVDAMLRADDLFTTSATWFGVKALAAMLRRWRTLDGAEVERIYREAVGAAMEAVGATGRRGWA